jgi:hypothetical protein
MRSLAGPLDRWVVLPFLMAMGRRRREAILARSSLGDAAHAFEPAGEVPGLPGWRCIPTPGHTPGHAAFLRPSDGVLVSGDALVTLSSTRSRAWHWVGRGSPGRRGIRPGTDALPGSPSSGWRHSGHASWPEAMVCRSRGRRRPRTGGPSRGASRHPRHRHGEARPTGTRAKPRELRSDRTPDPGRGRHGSKNTSSLTGS